MENWSPNIRFLVVCSIINFGFIASKNLLNIHDENKNVPNALFRYSNDSSNTSEAKIQLLVEINKKSNLFKNENKTFYVSSVFEARTKGEEKKLRVKRHPIDPNDDFNKDSENKEASPNTINESAIVDNNTQTRDQQSDRAVYLKRKHDNYPNIESKIPKIGTKQSAYNLTNMDSNYSIQINYEGLQQPIQITFSKNETNNGIDSSDANETLSYEVQQPIAGIPYELGDEPLDTENNRQLDLTRKIIDKGNTERMHFIEKVALYISNNCNETLENSEDMLKNYTLSFEKSSTVPTYDELAEDFCKNKTIPEKYQRWKIPRHPLIDDVLYQLNLDVISEKEARHNLKQILWKYNKTLITDCFKTYKNSPILGKYLRIQDFIILRLHFIKTEVSIHKLKMNKLKRLTVSLLRLALRELEIDSHDSSDKITLYRYRYTKCIGKKTLSAIADNHYETTNIEKFTRNIESEMRMLEEHNKLRGQRPLKIEIESLKPPAIPNIGLVFPDEENEIYIFPPETTFRIIETNSSVNGRPGLSIKLEDKRLKEEKMIDIINKIYNYLVTYPETYKIYNVEGLKVPKVVSQMNNQEPFNPYDIDSNEPLDLSLPNKSSLNIQEEHNPYDIDSNEPLDLSLPNKSSLNIQEEHNPYDIDSNEPLDLSFNIRELPIVPESATGSRAQPGGELQVRFPNKSSVHNLNSLRSSTKNWQQQFEDFI